MTEEEYREKFQNYMMRAMMEPDEDSRKEVTKQIKMLEKRHAQSQFGSNNALDDMFAETDTNISHEMVENTGGRVK